MTEVTFLHQQIGRWSLLVNPSIFENQNPVCIHQHRPAMRNDQGCSPLAESLDRNADPGLRSEIQVGSGFVQNQDH